MKSAILFLSVLFCTSVSLKAQEEIYQPTTIRDTVITNNIGSAPTESTKKDQQTDKKQAQDEDARTKQEKKLARLRHLRLGGNFGLQFGSYTYINISPTVGYLFLKDRLEAGAGPIFIYEHYRFSNTVSYNFFVTGMDVYAKGYIFRGLYAMAQFDLINKPSYVYYDKRVTVPHFLIGAGYSVPMGKVGYFNLQAMFSVINNSETIYRGTFGNFPLLFTMGFSFGAAKQD